MALTSNQKENFESLLGKKYREYICLCCHEKYMSLKESYYCSGKCRQSAYVSRLIAKEKIKAENTEAPALKIKPEPKIEEQLAIKKEAQTAIKKEVIPPKEPEPKKTETMPQYAIDAEMALLKSKQNLLKQQ